LRCCALQTYKTNVAVKQTKHIDMERTFLCVFFNCKAKGWKKSRLPVDTVKTSIQSGRLVTRAQFGHGASILPRFLG